MRKPKSLLLFLCLLGGLALAVYWVFVYPDHIDKSVGVFASRDAAERASIQMLSRQIQRYRLSSTYRIYFTLTAADHAGNGGAIMYDRNSGQIGIANDPDSGFIVYWEHVRTGQILAVAQTNGSLGSFGAPTWHSATWAP